MTPAQRVVAAADWRATVEVLVAKGYAYLDLLTGIDRGDCVEVVCHVMDPQSGERLLLLTTTPPGGRHLDSVAGVLPGAAWHERETAEMFGVEFVGHPDPRPLLTRGRSQPPPLAKATPLNARVTSSWPGVQPGAARRRDHVPGVPEAWRTAELSVPVAPTTESDGSGER